MTAKNDDPVDFAASTPSGSREHWMLEPKLGGVYLIELCSGELRHWRYLGPGEQANGWWHDMETGLEFSETSVMYAWRIVGVRDKNLQPAQESTVSLVQGNERLSKE